MSWKVFTARDIDKIDEFLSGLKRTNNFYAQPRFVRKFLVSALTRKPQVEGWIFRYARPRYTVCLIACIKREANRHICLFSYGRGTITKEIFYNLIETKMDDYVAGLGRTGWDIKVAKEQLNELGGVTEVNARAFVSTRKTTVITRSDSEISFITVDPI